MKKRTNWIDPRTEKKDKVWTFDKIMWIYIEKKKEKLEGNEEEKMEEKEEYKGYKKE